MQGDDQRRETEEASRSYIDSDIVELRPRQLEEARQTVAQSARLFLLAEEHHFSNREDEAVLAYNSIADRFPDGLYGHLANGQLAVIHGSLESALTEFLLAESSEHAWIKEGLIDEPEDRVRIHLGLTYRKLGKFDEALASFESVNPPERSNPNPFAYAGMATVYNAMMRVVEHEEDEDSLQGGEDLLAKVKDFVNLALSREPNMSYAKSVLAGAYFQSGQVDDAKRIAEEVVEAEPENWFVLGLLGNLHNKLKNIDLAIEHFEKAIQYAPKRESFARKGIAGIFLYLRPTDQNVSRAQALYEEVLAVNPEDVAALRGLGEALYRRQNYKKALEPLETALTLSSEHQEVRTRIALARVLLALDRIQAAEDVISPVIPKQNHTIYKLRGNIIDERRKANEIFRDAEAIFQQGQKDKALAQYLRCVDRDPTNQRAYFRIAFLFNSTGKYRDAISIGQTALELGDPTGQIDKQLADAYDRLGELRAAQRWTSPDKTDTQLSLIVKCY